MEFRIFFIDIISERLGIIGVDVIVLIISDKRQVVAPFSQRTGFMVMNNLVNCCYSLFLRYSGNPANSDDRSGHWIFLRRFKLAKKIISNIRTNVVQWVLRLKRRNPVWITFTGRVYGVEGPFPEKQQVFQHRPFLTALFFIERPDKIPEGINVGVTSWILVKDWFSGDDFHGLPIYLPVKRCKAIRLP